MKKRYRDTLRRCYENTAYATGSAIGMIICFKIGRRIVQYYFSPVINNKMYANIMIPVLCFLAESKLDATLPKLFEKKINEIVVSLGVKKNIASKEFFNVQVVWSEAGSDEYFGNKITIYKNLLQSPDDRFMKPPEAEKKEKWAGFRDHRGIYSSIFLTVDFDSQKIEVGSDVFTDCFRKRPARPNHEITEFIHYEPTFDSLSSQIKKKFWKVYRVLVPHARIMELEYTVKRHIKTTPPSKIGARW